MASVPPLDRKVPSFSVPPKRKEKPTVEPLVGLQRLIKQLDDVTAAVSDPTWMVKELRAMITTIKNTVELLKPLGKDWANVTQELKDLVAVISTITKNLVVEFEKHVTDTAAFTSYLHHTAFSSDFNKMMVNTHNLQNFLLRFGINGGLVSEIGCAQFSLPRTKWRYPVAYLPDRNLQFAPRNAEMMLLERALSPDNVICYNLVVPAHNDRGVGITEMLTEYCYRSVEDGVYGAVVWITGGTTAAITHSFRSFGKRIWLTDNTFCKNMELITTMDASIVIDKVVQWLQKLSYPWMLVFDGVVGERVIQKYMVPQFGSGTVVFSTHSNCTTALKDLCATTPEIIEINLLNHSEKLAIVNSLLNASGPAFSDTDMIELLKYFGGYPLEIVEACNLINSGNQRLQLKIGVHQYLNKLKFVEARGMRERDRTLYQTLNTALEVAVQLPRASSMAITAIVDLLPYIDTTEVDARVLLSWLQSSNVTMQLTVIDKDLNFEPESDVVTLTTETLLTVTVTTIIPHELHSNGGNHHSWNIQKTFLELQTFFDDMKKASKSLSTARFPGKPHRGSMHGADALIKVSLDDINFALHSLCSDPAWKQSCTDPDVKGFIGIQPQEYVFAEAGNRIVSILEPLVDVGIIRMKHRFGLIDYKEQCVSFSVCNDFYSAMTTLVRQENREESVLDDVQGFLLDCLEGVDGQPKLPAEIVIPHVVRVVNSARYTDVGMKLVSTCYAVAESLKFTADQAQLALAGLKFVRYGPFSLNGSPDEIKWAICYARVSLSLLLYEDAKTTLSDALELAVKLNIKHDVAVIQGLLGLVAERRNNFPDAEMHLVRSLEAWQLCFHGTKQKDVANCLQNLARVYRLDDKLDRSIEFDNLAVNVLISLYGIRSDAVYDAQINIGKILLDMKRYDAAMANFIKILQTCESEEGKENYITPVTQLPLSSARSPPVCILLCDCYTGKKLYSEAESLLNQSLDALFKVHRDKPHESIGIVLSKLGDVQTDQGNLEVALKSFKDAVDIFRCIYDANDARIAHAMNKIGNHLKIMGKFAFAESYYKGAVEIFEKKPCRDAAYAMINLADMLISQSRPGDALVIATKSVDMYRIIDTSNESVAFEYAAAITLKADIYKELGMFDKALERLEDVLLVLDKIVADNDSSVAEIYEKIADIYRLKSMNDDGDRYERLANAIYEQNGGPSNKKFIKPAGNAASSVSKVIAEKSSSTSNSHATEDVSDPSKDLLTRQGSTELMDQKEEDDQMFLRMQEELITKLVVKYGEKHQRVASALNNLSHLLIKKERYEEAIRMLVASLEILLYLYGDTHAHVATVYQNIGHVYQRRGRYEEAEALFQQALNVRRELSGDVSAHVAQSLNSLGLVYRAQGKYLNAKLCMEESLAIRRVLYGHSHFSIAVALNNLGMLQKSLWLYNEAEMSLKDGLSIRRTTFDEGHPSIAISMVNLGSLYVSMGKFNDARKLFENALAIQKEAFGERTHPDMTRTMTYLAELNIQENKLFSAKTVLEEIVKSRSDIHGNRNEDFYINIARLSRLYHAMNLSEEAEKLDQVLLERSTLCTKSKVDDKFVMLPEIEEDDRIVSRLMSFGSFDGVSGKKKDNMRLDMLQHNKNHSFLTSDHEEIPRWLVAVGESISALCAKKKQDYSSTTDLKNALTQSFEDVNADLQGLQQTLEENKSKISKLEKLAQKNTMFEKEIIDVQYDSATTEKEMDIVLRRREEMEKEMQRATVLHSSAKKSSKKLEEDVPKFELLRVSLLAGIESIRAKEEILFHKKQDVLRLMETDQRGVFNAMEYRGELETAESEKLEIEAMLRVERDEQSNSIGAIYDICQQLGVNVPPPSAERQRLVEDGSNKKPRRKHQQSDSDYDDNTSIDSFDSGVDASGSDTDGIGKGDKSTLKLKRRIKRQRMLIDLLRSQLISLGVRPIEEVVSFDRAEARLKDALQRLLEGDEGAATEFERWDEYVRNHPEYKRRELEKQALWRFENMPLNHAASRNVKTFIPVDIFTCTKDYLSGMLPRALARRVWNEKCLWLLQMSPHAIAKLHIADLQSKFSTQGLDEIELRAVYFALPDKFENDSTGEKENWRDGILQRLQGKRTELPWSGANEEPPEEVVSIFLKSIARNGAYRSAPEVGPFDPDALPAEFEGPGAVFREAEKYNPSSVHSTPAFSEGSELPGGNFSILETVQSVHNKLSHVVSRNKEEIVTEEEDIVRKERRRLSLSKLRNRKAALDDVHATLLRSASGEDDIDDSFDMFPSRLAHRKPEDSAMKRGPVVDGLQEAVLKRRVMLDSAKSPSSRQMSTQNLGIETATPRGPGNLSKGESFRAAPGRVGLTKGESFRAPILGSTGPTKDQSRRGLMISAGSQKSIKLTGPHHLTEEDGAGTPRKGGIARQPSMLQKMFAKKGGGSGDAGGPLRNIGSPGKEGSSFNLFSS